MKVQVLGPGCAKCKKVEKIVREVIVEAGIEAEVVKVSDFQEIASFGVFSTPAVAIDGDVKVVGRVPGKDEILEWIK